MNITELFNLIRLIEIGPTELTLLQERLRIAEEEFKREDTNRLITKEWLDRTYTI